MCSIARGTITRSAREAVAVPQAAGSRVSVWVAAYRSDPIHLSVSVSFLSDKFHVFRGLKKAILLFGYPITPDVV